MDLKKKAPGREWSLLKNEKPVWKKWKEEQSANHYLQFPMSCVMMHHHGLVLASTIRKALVHAFTHIRDDDCHRYPWLQAMKDSSIYKRIVRNVIFLESCMQLFDRKILKFQTIHSSTRSEKARMENEGKNASFDIWSKGTSSNVSDVIVQVQVRVGYVTNRAFLICYRNSEQSGSEG